jgi:hypothetical protein
MRDEGQRASFQSDSSVERMSETFQGQEEQRLPTVSETAKDAECQRDVTGDATGDAEMTLQNRDRDRAEQKDLPSTEFAFSRTRRRGARRAPWSREGCRSALYLRVVGARAPALPSHNQCHLARRGRGWAEIGRSAGDNECSLSWLPDLSWQFRGEKVDFLDCGRSRQQLVGLGHERRGDGAPPRWACRPASSAKASKMPNVLGPN